MLPRDDLYRGLPGACGSGLSFPSLPRLVVAPAAEPCVCAGRGVSAVQPRERGCAVRLSSPVGAGRVRPGFTPPPAGLWSLRVGQPRVNCYATQADMAVCCNVLVGPFTHTTPFPQGAVWVRWGRRRHARGGDAELGRDGLHGEACAGPQQRSGPCGRVRSPWPPPECCSPRCWVNWKCWALLSGLRACPRVLRAPGRLMLTGSLLSVAYVPHLPPPPTHTHRAFPWAASPKQRRTSASLTQGWGDVPGP
jgi:hypothetical protein